MPRKPCPRSHCTHPQGVRPKLTRRAASPARVTRSPQPQASQGPAGVLGEHLVRTRSQALEEIQFGLEQWVEYFENVAVIPMVPPDRRGDPAAHLIESGMAAIGTPDDCIAQIEGLWESSQGGFGCYLITDHNWAPFQAKLNSYDMVGRYVIPHFQQQNRQREASYAWVGERQKDFKASHEKASNEQIERHARELKAREA